MDIVSFNWNTIYNLFSPNERSLILPNKNVKNDQANFAKALLSEDLYNVLFTISKSTTQRIFTNNNNVIKRFYSARTFLLDQTDSSSGLQYKFGEAPFWKKTLNNWTLFFEKLSAQEPAAKERFFSIFRNDILCKIDQDADCSGLYEYLNSLSEDTIAEAFTCLCLVSSTIPFWNQQDEEQNQYLYDLIVDSQFEQDIAQTNRQNQKKKNKEIAEEEIEEARTCFFRSDKSRDDAKKCYLHSKKILDLRPVVLPDICGEAAYMIFKLADSNEIALPKGESAYAYLEKSNNLGYYLAKAEWMDRQTKSLLHPYKKSSDFSIGTYIINCDNERSRFLRNTIPGNWSDGQSAVTGAGILANNSSCSGQITVEEAIEEQTCPGKKLKYFFIDEDYRTNLQQTLLTLQRVLNSPKKSGWDLEIYLRGEEEVAAPVIDTALSHLGSITIPVYILDDEKFAAQQLLAFHPLFYPLVSQSEKAAAVLNLVILGDSRCAEWIIRESSWLMTFRNANIQPKIVLLGKNSENLKNRIYSVCPGMVSGKNGIPTEAKEDSSEGDKRLQAITDVKPIEIQSPKYSEHCVDIDSFELNTFLKELFSGKNQENNHYYFVVATDDMDYNFTLAKRLRENIIREYILRGNMEALEHLPVVSFYSTDPDISHVSHTMVAQLEDLGNRWYNNYSLIPFGSISRYHWDQIDGGILEEMAKCIHLQYCSIPMDPNDHSTDMYYSRADAMHDYYSRFYNRDSSFAVAIGLTYRLFQCDKETHRTIPSHWSIINGKTFSEASSLEGLARKFEDAVKFNREKEYDALARYEHSRWIRFMCSRGWMPATPEQTVAYLKAQKTEKAKHQLYIAKLHPCMCDYDQLDSLHKYIVAEVGEEFDLKEFFRKKDFKKIDLDNIRKTGDFLKRSWFVHELETNHVTMDPER